MTSSSPLVVRVVSVQVQGRGPPREEHTPEDRVVAADGGLIGATLVAMLIITDVIQIWMLYPLSALEGFGDAINQPARQVMIYDVVGADDLPNAVAVNSLGSNTMRIVGPSLAGALIGAVGIQAAFIVQAAAYAFSVYATSRIKTRGVPAGRGTSTVRPACSTASTTRGRTAMCCCWW